MIKLTVKTRRRETVNQEQVIDTKDIVGPIEPIIGGSLVMVRETLASPGSEIFDLVEYSVEETLSEIVALAPTELILLNVTKRRGLTGSYQRVFNLPYIAGTIVPAASGSTFMYKEEGDPNLVEYTVSETISAISEMLNIQSDVQATPITYAGMDNLIATDSVVQGQNYLLTDKDIIVTGVSSNAINPRAVGKFLNADYQGEGDYSGVAAFANWLGIWRKSYAIFALADIAGIFQPGESVTINGDSFTLITSSDSNGFTYIEGNASELSTLGFTDVITGTNSGATASISNNPQVFFQPVIGDVAIYKNKHYRNLTGENDTVAPDADIINWQLLATSATTGFIEVWNAIEYDFAYDRIYKRTDHVRGINVSSSHQYEQYNGWLVSSVEVFPWGNDNIHSVDVRDAYCDLRQCRGLVRELSMEPGSYLYDVIIDTGARLTAVHMSANSFFYNNRIQFNARFDDISFGPASGIVNSNLTAGINFAQNTIGTGISMNLGYLDYHQMRKKIEVGFSNFEGFETLPAADTEIAVRKSWFGIIWVIGTDAMHTINSISYGANVEHEVEFRPSPEDYSTMDTLRFSDSASVKLHNGAATVDILKASGNDFAIFRKGNGGSLMTAYGKY